MSQPQSALAVSNGLAPEGDPKAITLSFDFSTLSSYTEDFMVEETNGRIGNVQAIFVDNQANAAPTVILFAITNQRLVVPAGKQGVFPVFAIPGNTTLTISTTPAANLRVQAILLNVPLPFAAW